MIASVEQVKLGVLNFVEAEIASKAVGFQKFATYFAMPIIGKKVEEFAKTFFENNATKDFFDGNGNVKLDEVYNTAKASVQKSGQFTVYGVMLGETDIDKLYEYIRRAQA